MTKVYRDQSMSHNGRQGTDCCVRCYVAENNSIIQCQRGTMHCRGRGGSPEGVWISTNNWSANSRKGGLSKKKAVRQDLVREPFAPRVLPHAPEEFPLIGAVAEHAEVVVFADDRQELLEDHRLLCRRVRPERISRLHSGRHNERADEVDEAVLGLAFDVKIDAHQGVGDLGGPEDVGLAMLTYAGRSKVTQTNFERIKVGMTKSEVFEMLGEGMEREDLFSALTFASWRDGPSE